MTRQPTQDPPVVGGLSRRRALTGAATVGLALPVLAACGDDAARDVTGGTSTAPAPDPTATSTPAPTVSPEPTPGSSAREGGLASTDDIPVGGGTIFTDDRVVVTQPVAGEFRCFSAVCTHEQCLVTEVASTITCRCHSSSFDLSTGEVLGGPAPAPLPAVDFTISQNQVVLS